MDSEELMELIDRTEDLLFGYRNMLEAALEKERMQRAIECVVTAETPNELH